MPKIGSLAGIMKPWPFSNRGKTEPPARPSGPGKIRIASPCSANWEEMKGNDWVRHCTECNLNVYNFSAMTWKEVETLIASHQGRLCARFYRRADGTVLTQDCPKGLQAVVRRVSRWAGAAFSAMAVFSAAGSRAASPPESQPLVRIKGAQTTESAKQEPATVVLQITDPQGAVIAGAAVKLVNQASGQSWDATTGEQGRVRLQVPGRNSYHVMVSAMGFSPYQQDINLTSAEAQFNFKLQVAASMGEVVEVFPEIPAVDAPFQSNLQPVPESPASRPAKKHKSRKSPTPAGTADPSPVPLNGQPHAVVHLKVTDPQGAMIPGARVKLRDRHGSRQWGGTTDARGEFSMPFLPLGNYTLTIQSPGMGSYETVIEAGNPGLVNRQVALHPGALMGDVMVDVIKTAPVDFSSTVSTTFRPSDR